MGNTLKIFDYNDKMVRTVTANNEPWWVLKDVCEILELSDTSKVAERLDDDELTRIKIVSGKQNREMLCVNESGLYATILRSNKKEAKTFRKWVTSEVLPSIRKTGSYSTEQTNFQQESINQQLQNLLLQQTQFIQTVSQALQTQLPQPTYPQKHTPFKTKAFAKLNLLAEHYQEPLSKILHNAIIELEDTYDISLSDYKTQYIINTRLKPEEAQILDIIEYSPDLTKLFMLTLNNILEQNNIPYEHTEKRENMFVQALVS